MIKCALCDRKIEMDQPFVEISFWGKLGDLEDIFYYHTNCYVDLITETIEILEALEKESDIYGKEKKQG